MPSDADDLASPPGQRPIQRSNTFTDTSYKIARTFSQATRDAINAEVPSGAWAAAAGASSKAPTLGEIRRGFFAESRWQNGAGLLGRTASGHELSAIKDAEDRESNSAHSAWMSDKLEQGDCSVASEAAPLYGERAGTSSITRGSVQSADYAQQPKVPWTRSTIIGLKAFWKWFLTPFGFLVTIYALNVVAWGGMLFLLLCNAAPEMCWVLDEQDGWIRDCDNLYSSRRKWLEN